MNTELTPSARTFVALLNGMPVAHVGFINNPFLRNLRRVHRFVVLPDYQGIGIGTNFISECAKIMQSEGHEIQLITTTPALVKGLIKNKNWWLKDFGRRKGDNNGNLKIHSAKSFIGASSKNRITYNFIFRHNLLDAPIRKD